MRLDERSRFFRIERGFRNEMKDQIRHLWRPFDPPGAARSEDQMLWRASGVGVQKHCAPKWRESEKELTGQTRLSIFPQTRLRRKIGMPGLSALRADPSGKARRGPVGRCK